MWLYILKRLGLMIPMLLGITLISFTVIHLAPGTPTDMQTTMNPKASLEAQKRLRELYGLDKPLMVQYGDWLTRLVASGLRPLLLPGPAAGVGQNQGAHRHHPGPQPHEPDHHLGRVHSHRGDRRLPGPFLV